MRSALSIARIRASLRPLKHTALAGLLLAAPALLAAERRSLQVDDLFELKDVGDPRLSPDGRFVAYTLTTLDRKEDRSDGDVYLAPLDGGQPLRLTSSPKTESRARFSPDGEWIAFLSGRESARSQVFLLSLRGGEAVKLTDFKGGVSDLAWSPDSKRLALVVSDPDPDAPPDEEDQAKATKRKTAKPIVLRRLQFKRDGEGYLRDRYSHVHVFDVAAKTSFQLTSGAFDDSSPAWSPDGARVAFVSNRTLPDPDASLDTDVLVVAASPGAIPRTLAGGPGPDSSPAWSPDGAFIAYRAGGDPKDLWYGASHVALAPSAGGPSRPLTAALDRNVGSPRFAADGRSVLFLLEDGGNQHLARVVKDGGPVERLVAGERDVRAFDVAADGTIVVLESTPQQPGEISRLSASGLARVTRVNDAYLEGIRLAAVERFKATSRDGTPVDGFLTLPPGHSPGRPIPTLLRIHGGPASQYSTAWSFEWQVLAAQGYAVVAANPRGSTGYGTAFSRAIWAEWGVKDFEDVMAAVDHAVARGIADPESLGVGGWSYGGMLTDHVITKTTRFKAAVSGASIANILAGYGTDHYQRHYEVELGLPWKERERWLAVSSPFFDASKVVTPTLVMCGELDMNVPLINSEQLYQALRRVGKAETELVIYPGQWHGIRTPSYQKDRLERYLAWYDRFLRPDRAGTSAASGSSSAGATAGDATAGPPSEPEATSLLGRPLTAPPLAPERQAALEADLARATAECVKSPDSADAAVWLGRRYAYLGRYREAILAFTRGLARHPNDARLLRHRGHRHITTRQLDKAVADLARAAELVKGRKDEPEPGSDPSAPATTTLHYSVYYHLGLAHYLKGDFASAERAYRRCLETARGSDENLVGVSDWLYMTLRRLGKAKEAAALLGPIRADMKAGDSRVYLNRLLMYKGEYTPEDLLRAGGDPLSSATYAYAVGNWYLVNGRATEARAAFERANAGEQWAAFGYIAAEAELARGSAPAR
jgi:dipeptidyl aminopeptidase/acylaminoacyl peptidase